MKCISQKSYFVIVKQGYFLLDCFVDFYNSFHYTYEEAVIWKWINKLYDSKDIGYINHNL